MAECSVCTSGNLDSINAALDAGKTFREIGREFHVAKSTLHRHATVCRVMLEARGALLTRRREERAVQTMERATTSTMERLAPIDALASELLTFITSQIERGKAPNLSLVRTWLQAQETTLKAQALLEQRQGTSQVASGLLEAGRTVSFLAEHYPEALAALRAHLEAVA